MAFGDMPYHNPEDLQRFERLTKSVNQDRPAFSVHVGDIKSGQSNCNDEYFYLIKNLFMHFNGPLIYTPGDNEWTDCTRPECGGYDQLERLQKIRQVFYYGKKSMGKKALAYFQSKQY